MSQSPLKAKVYRMATLRCQDCSVLFERRAKEATRAKDGGIRCNRCSRSHRQVGRVYPRRPGVWLSLTCVQCGVEYERPRSRVREGQTVVLCSLACRKVWKLDHPSRNFIGAADNRGERNGRYTNGKRVGEHINRKEVRFAVAARDGDWCLLCGASPPGLHLHRVVYASQGGVYEETNCVQLCGDHHATVHSNKRVWMPLLLAHIARENPSTEDRLPA